MRIRLLTAYFPPETGSASHLFFDIGKELVQRGHEVTVVTGMPRYHVTGTTTRGRTGLVRREHVAGMVVLRVAMPNPWPGSPVGRGVWQLWCGIAGFLRGVFAPKAECTLVYSPPLTMAATAVALGRFQGSKVVVNVQDLFPKSAIDLGMLRNESLVRASEALESWVYRNADALVFHSPGNLEHAVKAGADRSKCWTVHNCVDLEALEANVSPEEAKEKFGLLGKFVVSFAGVMGYSQDIDVILEVAKILQEERDVAFLLVGGGVEKDRLVSKSDEMGLLNVVWLPMQPRDRYPRVLYASDVCITTLKREVRSPVVPSKILSAMAVGRPVVAAVGLDGDTPKLLEESGAGWAVPPGDPEELANAILRLRDDPGLRARMGRAARTFIDRHCTTERVVDRYLQIFETIVRTDGGGTSGRYGQSPAAAESRGS